jgi:hypothetical protein
MKSESPRWKRRSLRELEGGDSGGTAAGHGNVNRANSAPGPVRKYNWERCFRVGGVFSPYGRYPKACPFVTLSVADHPVSLTYTWHVAKYKEALTRDGVYLLRSNQACWSAREFWETYMQLSVVERAFRVLKSHLLLRPIWHHYSGRTQAHVFVCVLAYALWKTLDHLAKRAGLQTLIHKPDPRRGNAAPNPRPMTPEVILRELAKIQIGDILLETTTGRQLALRRVARPSAEQKRILDALGLDLPERLSTDRLL